MKNKTDIFISHINEERDLALLFKEHIRRDFLALLSIFVSADNESNPLGTDCVQISMTPFVPQAYLSSFAVPNRFLVHG